MSYQSRMKIFSYIFLGILFLTLSITPLTAASLAQAVGDTFTVNTTADTTDFSGADLICADSNGDCSLRAAISQANTDADMDTINLPAGTYNLGITTANDENNLSGDLDVNESLTITGAGSAITTINWFAGAGGTTRYDRIFHVDADTINTAVTFNLSGVTLTGGRHAAITLYGTNDILNLSDCILQNNVNLISFNRRGGALVNYGTATVDNCLISGNSAEETQYGNGGGVFNNTNATMTITNTSITGNISTFGGGLENWGMMTLTDSHVDNNISRIAGNNGGSGGGIRNAGTLTIDNSTVNNNDLPTVDFFDGYGGGILNSGTLTIRQSDINGNQAHYGAGISSSGILIIEDSNILNNPTKKTRSDDEAGGIRNTGQMTINRSLISGNSSRNYGGGVYNSGTLRLINSTISGNSTAATPTQTYGGGIYNTGTLYLTSATITLNTASVQGGGLYQAAGKGTTTAANSIIAGNAAVVSGFDCFYAGGAIDRMISLGFNLLSNDNNCAGFVNGDDKVINNTLLGPLQENGGPTRSHALLTGSPALNAVPLNACVWDDDSNDTTPRISLTVDQRGYVRPLETACDIGAVEGQAPPEILSLWFFTTLTPTLTWNSVTWATGYQVQVATDDDFGAADIVYENLNIASDTLQVTINPALPDDGEYYWHVRALNGNWSSPIKITVDAP